MSRCILNRSRWLGKAVSQIAGRRKRLGGWSPVDAHRGSLHTGCEIATEEEAMEAFTLDPDHPHPTEAVLGAIITEEVRAGGRRLFRKGHRLGEADLAALATLDQSVHAVRL